MQAFGPYMEETCCDFTRLSDDSLFLITGATGSGKTAILDAMSFSLYGHATGLLRTFYDMRNNAAPEALETRTQFEFALDGNIYKFVRWIKIHTKHTGEKTKTVSAECYIKNGEEWELICSDDRRVSAAACELLGFNHSQFSQVIVLPQGEFRKLLISPSKDKAEILRVLFATGRWQNITDIALDKSRTMRSEYEAVLARCDALLQSTGAESDEELAALLDKCEKELADLTAQAKEHSEQFEAARTKHAALCALAEKFAERERTAKDYAALAARGDEMRLLAQRAELYGKAAAVRPYLEAARAAENMLSRRTAELCAAEKSAAAAESSCKAAEEEAAALPDMTQRRRKIYDDIAVCAALLPDAEAYYSGEGKIGGLKKSIDSLTEKKRQLAESMSALDTRIRKNKDYIASCFKKYIEDYPAMLTEQRSLNEKLAAGGEYTSLLGQRGAAEKEYERLKKEAAEAEAKLRAAEAELAGAEKEYLEDAAARLADALCDGAPCPVCGALHHPAPAAAHSAVPRASLDGLRSTVSAARDVCRVYSEKLARSGAELTAITDKLATLSPVSDEETENAAARLAELNTVIAEAEVYKTKYSRQQAQLTALEEEYAALRRTDGDISAQLSAESSALAAAQTKQESIRSRLPEGTDIAGLSDRLASLKKSGEELTRRLEDIQQRAAQTKQELSLAQAQLGSAKKSLAEAEASLGAAKAAFSEKCVSAGIAEADAQGDIPDAETVDAMRRSIDEYKSSVALLKGQIALLDAELSGREPPDTEAAERELAEAREQDMRSAQAVGSAAQRLGALRNTAASLDALKKKNEKTAATIDRINRISEMLAGRNIHRTALQDFVLGLMLDDVVAAACRYLTELSQGRFALIRIDAEGGTARRGLDIEVLDAHTGGRRRVCTLSGGELFLASLSLAFGLAEVVQSGAGGIHLDSIFIDEGFGSLDAQTLNLAMNAFDKVRRDGRMVGIISHVEELRDRIGARIEVRSTPDGSKIDIR